jgi:hypothetical protein
MKILYFGDIMASPGRAVMRVMVPELRKELGADIVVAQAENVSHGKSMSPAHMKELQGYGIDFFTGGNHTPERPDIHPFLTDSAQPVIAPVNMDAHPDRWGVKMLKTAAGNILFVSLLGQTVPKSPPMSNPLRVMDSILAQHKLKDYAAIVVNFHGDYSSEKRVVGYYLDGQVSAVIGDHWHVPTADAMVLPHGTAHITDVGMVGTLHSSLGVELKQIFKRWHDEVLTSNTIEEMPPFQCNAVLIDIDADTHLAKSIAPVNKVIEKLT